MTQQAANFHTKRRAFIILSDIGLLVAPKDYNISHEQMLEKLGLSQDDILKLMTIHPRGYFMDGELCIYQGYDMTLETKWQLTADGRKVVQKYIEDLRRIFSLNDNTPVYLGVIVGQIGDVLKKINMVRLKTLENGNIVM